MARNFLFFVLFWAIGVTPALAQTPDLAKPKPAEEKKAETPKASVESKIQNAERIARLQSLLKQDEKMREKLKEPLDRLDGAVSAASKELVDLDEKLQQQMKILEKLGKGAREEATAIRDAIAELSTQKDLGQKHLSLTIQERKVLLDRIGGLDEKILQNQLALDGLLRGDAEGATGTTAENALLKKARADARRKETEAKDAQLETKSMQQRVDAMEKFIDLEQSLGATEKEKIVLVRKHIEALEREREGRIAANAPAGDVDNLDIQIAETQRRLDDLEGSLTKRSDLITLLQTKLTALKQEQAHAEAAAAQKSADADAAKEQVERLENPFDLGNILRWFASHGPKILFILLAMIGMRYLIRVLDKRLLRFMSNRGSLGTVEERENRAQTLVSVFHNFAVLLLLCGGSLMIMEEMGIPIVPLMGGAAILGLAIAFGAQNLIKDYFYGFVILLESQYAVNDVIRIGNISGLVERISLRMTVLRDLEGVVHFIPHGQVTSVSNLTHGWSRALFDISVSYRENPDYVMEVLGKIALELRQDPLYCDLILEDPEMRGVQTFSESAMVIRFLLKTRPLKQWKVKNEMMRRIKKTFDEIGIEIPFPHRVVVHQYEGENGTAARRRAA